MKPVRDTCRLLLLRLKMDGWALGKSKVFLKYYHVEVLARIYEEQVAIDTNNEIIFVVKIVTKMTRMCSKFLVFTNNL